MRFELGDRDNETRKIIKRIARTFCKYTTVQKDKTLKTRHGDPRP